MTLRAEILCRVVDNFGDAGVCWRLARQLAREHRWQVRLTIDQPQVLARLGARTIDGVRVRRWPKPQPQSGDALDGDALDGGILDGGILDGDALDDDVLDDDANGAARCDVLVSAFGAEPPPALRASLAGGVPRPLWVHLEYLSAEEWVAGCHGLRSTKPADGAVEHFYYPGFDERSGGLLRERDLFAQRDAFAGSPAQAQWLAARGIETRADESVATLFCYPQAPLVEWFAALDEGRRPWRVLVPESVADEALAACFGESPPPGRVLRRGRLALQRIAFQSQDDYDRLLWSADLNFVRGEDSWIRAHWAARPFVWQPYPQQEDTHRIKLRAFLQRMQAGPAVDTMMFAWSGAGALRTAWAEFESALPALGEPFRRWTRRLASQPDLASQLARFCLARL